MAISDAKRTRAPRGSGPVTKAFLIALEAVPETSRAAVAKASLAMIRDEMKLLSGNLKRSAAKTKAKAKAEKPKARKAKAAAAEPEVKKRRGRKPASAAPVA